MKIGKYTIWLILLINIIIFGLINWGLPIRFEENDDIIMCLIANGGYTGAPDCHLVFINALYGSILAWLYTIIPTIEWYTVSFFILHIVSITCIVYLVAIKSKRSTIVKLVWLSFIYILWMRMILSLQFTTTAGITTMAGCWLMCQNTRKKNLLGGLLIIIASMLRFHIVGLIVLMFIPVYIFQFHLEFKRYIPLIIVGMVVFSVKFIDNSFYQSPEWKYFKEYNYIRGQLNDNPNADKQYVYDNLPNGIEKADYDMLLNFMADPAVMDLKTIKVIFLGLKEVSLKEKINNVCTLRLYFSIILLLLCLTVLLLVNSTKNEKAYLVVLCLLFCCIAVGISMNGTLKNRVFLCMLLSIMIGYYQIATQDKASRCIILLCIFCVVMLMNGKYIKQMYKTSIAIERKILLWNEVDTLLKTTVQNENYVISIGADMLIEGMSVYKVRIPNYRIIGLGWLISTPFNAGIFDTYMDLTRDDIYIVSTNENTTVGQLQSLILNNYLLYTREKIIASSEHYKIIKLIPMDYEHPIQ